MLVAGFFGRTESVTVAPVQESAPRMRAVENVIPVVTEVPVLDRIVTLHPRSYNDARMIGEHFREYTPVIMNLTEMDDADAKRFGRFCCRIGIWSPRLNRESDHQGIFTLTSKRQSKR